MVDISIVNGDYKPTYNWGAQPCEDGPPVIKRDDGTSPMTFFEGFMT